MEKTGSKIGPVNAVLLVFAALFFDGVQVLLIFLIIGSVLNWIVSLIAIATFYLWLKLLGISFWEGKGTRKLLAFMGSSFMEIIPIFNAFLGWTIFVGLIILFEYAERIPVFGKVAALTAGRKAVPSI